MSMSMIDLVDWLGTSKERKWFFFLSSFSLLFWRLLLSNTYTFLLIKRKKSTTMHPFAKDFYYVS